MPRAPLHKQPLWIGAVLSLPLSLFGACNPNPIYSTPTPIPVAAGPGGALWSYAKTSEDPSPVPVLIDTGTVLTTRSAPAAGDGGTGVLRTTNVTLYDVPQASSDAPVARAELDQVNVLEAPLGSLVTPAGSLPLGGIVGGDLLEQFTVHLRYGGSGPTVALEPQEAACSCAIADQCDVELPFTLAGGGTLALGENVYTYPATRVTVDACLEPLTDPIARGVLCSDPEPADEGYDVDGRPGVDARLLVATGFPGMILSASVYERLCASSASTVRHAQLCAGGDAQAVLAKGPALTMTLPSGETVTGVQLALGDAQAKLAALALVGREGLLGGCGELARSRRLRGHPKNPTVDIANPSCGNLAGIPEGASLCLKVIDTQNCGSPNRCDDRAQPAAGFIELDAPLPFLLVPDGTQLLQEANYDVHPTLSDIEGVVGSELLARLDARIDYPRGRKLGRVIAHCASCGMGCVAYPRYTCSGQPSVVGCGSEGQTQDEPSLCNAPALLVPSGPLCLAAPKSGGDRDAGVSTCTPVATVDGGSSDGASGDGSGSDGASGDGDSGSDGPSGDGGGGSDGSSVDLARLDGGAKG